MHSDRQAKKRATSSFVGSSEKNDYNLEEARNSNDDVDGNNGMEKEKRQVSGSTDFVTFTKQQRPLANALMNTAHYYLSLSLRSPRMNSVLINSIIFSVGLSLGLSIGIGGLSSSSYCGMDMQTQKDTMAPVVRGSINFLPLANEKEIVESKWAIVMASSNEPYYHLNLRLTQAYAKRHGYKVLSHVDESPENHTRVERYRQKLVKILEAFDMGYEYAYWKDTDFLIMDCDRTLDDIFASEQQKHRERMINWANHNGQVDKTIKALAYEDIDAVFTGDTDGYICSGNMWLRNSNWTRDLLSRALEIYDAGSPQLDAGSPQLFDQSAIQYVLLGEPLDCRKSIDTCFKHEYECLNGGCENSFPLSQAKHFTIADMDDLSRFREPLPGRWSVHLTTFYKGEQKLLEMEWYSIYSSCTRENGNSAFDQPKQSVEVEQHGEFLHEKLAVLVTGAGSSEVNGCYLLKGRNGNAWEFELINSITGRTFEMFKVGESGWWNIMERVTDNSSRNPPHYGVEGDSDSRIPPVDGWGSKEFSDSWLGMDPVPTIEVTNRDVCRSRK